MEKIKDKLNQIILLFFQLILAYEFCDVSLVMP